MIADSRPAPAPAVGPWPRADAVWAQAASENFAVAPALLGRRASRHLRAIYLFARLVDDLGDVAPGDRLAELDRAEWELDRAFDGSATEPIFVELAVAIHACGFPRGPFLRLIDANRRDQRQLEYETYDDLLAYCELSANPVGELVLHVFGAADPERVALSDAVCSGLQLLEHWQDVGEDARRGRIYLPREDRARFGVADADLLAPGAGEGLRQLLAFETGRAVDLLASGRPLVAALHGRARVAVAGYVGGGLACAAALERAGYDVLGATPRAGKARRAWATVGAFRS